MLHVVRTTKVPVLIMIDCKAVVNTMQRFLDTGARGDGTLSEQDLWDYIFECSAAAKGYIRVQWMPSHLGEKGKEKQKEDAISAGLLEEEDILGNDEADKLAKKRSGNAYHQCTSCRGCER